MKSFLPASLLFVGMFVAGCQTPENTFMAGGQPVAAKPAPVAKVAPAKPVAPAPVVALPKPKPVAVNKPAVMVTNPAPVIAPAPAKPAVVPTAPAAPLPTIVTPDASIAGRVVVYNSGGRFVVLSFPAGAMPKLE